MKTNNEVIKVKKTGGSSTKILILDEFLKLEELEQIKMIHKQSEFFFKEYKKITKFLLEGLGDGLKKAKAIDGVGTSNPTGINDITASVAMKRTCISTYNVEQYYEYGKDEYMDKIIEFERILKLYHIVLGLYDDKMSKILWDRMNGKRYIDMAEKENYTVETLRDYVSASNKTIEEKYKEAVCIRRARECARKK